MPIINLILFLYNEPLVPKMPIPHNLDPEPLITPILAPPPQNGLRPSLHHPPPKIPLQGNLKTQTILHQPSNNNNNNHIYYIAVHF